jgi:hypothetical protein
LLIIYKAIFTVIILVSILNFLFPRNFICKLSFYLHRVSTIVVSTSINPQHLSFLGFAIFLYFVHDQYYENVFNMDRLQDIRPYSKSTLILNEWRFYLSFSWVSMLFLNSWRVSVVPYWIYSPSSYSNWHSRKAQIEPPLIECDCECSECGWAFKIRFHL